MLADILYDLPGLLRNECFVRILKAQLLRLGTLNALLVLEGQGGGLQVDGVTQVSLILRMPATVLVDQLYGWVMSTPVSSTPCF